MEAAIIVNRLNKTTSHSWLCGTLLAVLLFPVSPRSVAEQTQEPAEATSTESAIEVYKSAWCGCCKDWVTHLQAHGFETRVKELDDVSPIKAKAGLPPALASCHTAFINGYVIEGHVPAQDIRRLLRERPAIKGLAVPGMPAGKNVPGMEVNNRDAKFDILAIDSQGHTKVWQHYE
ncbi:MAG: DUF411 domain-containing protein [Hahellaceae bacterium]|nr:DUF411 domain-containing protein [Hahellaceae bacterium]